MENKRRTFEKTYREQHGWLRLKYQRLFKGLKKIHIGDDVWLVGKDKKLKDGRRHQVIYGPNNKEYHLYDGDVKFINMLPDTNRHGNTAHHASVKIYILTHILDQKENWCFDLNKKPQIGSLKMIYDNGTVKNIEFDGEYKAEELISKRHKWSDNYTSQTFVKPVAYRLK